jgi:23S rRNA (guanosine2251-2'-O)-methyltransferase
MPFLGNRDSIIEIIRNHPERVKKLWVEEGFQTTFSKVIDEAKKSGIPFRIVAEEEFTRRFKGVKGRICLESEEFSYIDPDALLSELPSLADPFFAAFDSIFDPQNLGNIVRSAACLSTHGIILPKDRSCSVTETVTRVARGGTEHVKIARVTNLARYLEELKRRNIFCYGLDQKGKVFLQDIDLRGPVCLVLGSEEGLRRLTREKCDEIVRIPTNPAFPSLNVATSFAIAAYEVARQRRNEGR